MTSVLHVDDDPDDHDIFLEVVKSLNPKLTCHYARSVDEALLLLDQLKTLPDYIFLDLNMPVKSGKYLLVELRKNERLSDIHVVIYSTSENPSDKLQCERLGAIAFITKPADLNSMYKAISRIIPPAG